MKKHYYFFPLKWLICAFAVACNSAFSTDQLERILFGPEGAADWSPDLEKTVKSILECKISAMAADDMRIREFDQKTGETCLVHGIAFQEWMKAIDAAAGPEDLQKAKELEGESLAAKLIVFSKDRRNRPEHYDTIRTTYVDLVLSEQQRKNGADGVGTEPTPVGGYRSHPVLPQHLTEEWRLPIEYYFFAPPMGRPFQDDLARSHLGIALFRIGNVGKTNVLMLADAASAGPHIEKDDPDGMRMVGFWYILNNPNSINANYLEMLLAGESAFNYEKRILGTVVGLPSDDATDIDFMANKIWTIWLKFFEANPIERKNATRLAKLFKQAAAEAEKGKQ